MDSVFPAGTTFYDNLLNAADKYFSYDVAKTAAKAKNESAVTPVVAGNDMNSGNAGIYQNTQLLAAVGIAAVAVLALVVWKVAR